MSSPIPYKYLWLGATALTIVFVMNAWVSHNLGLNESSFNWFFETTTVAAVFILWTIYIPLIQRFVIENKNLWKLSIFAIVFHIITSLLIALIHQFTSLSLYVLINWVVYGYLLNLFGEHSLAWILKGSIPSFIQYWLIISLLVGVSQYRQKRKQELLLIHKDKEIADAKFNALKMQLHPHFFFNTLNTISSIMDKNVEDAQMIVAKLAQLMRSLVDSDRKQFIKLADEVEYIKDYLHLEQARFEGHLKVIYNIDPDSEAVLVPNLILQPLVENAIKHGIANLKGEKTIRLYSKVKNSQLEISISDNGHGVANTDFVLQNPGVGLKSLINRLDHYYSLSAKIKIDSSTNQGFTIYINIPINETEKS